MWYSSAVSRQKGAIIDLAPKQTLSRAIVTDTERLKSELEAIKGEIALMTAENFAVELVLKNFFNRVNAAGLHPHLMQAFDDASKDVENLGVASGQARQTIRIIEQMRSMFVEGNRPLRGS
jgi:hypothetical protein